MLDAPVMQRSGTVGYVTPLGYKEVSWLAQLNDGVLGTNQLKDNVKAGPL